MVLEHFGVGVTLIGLLARDLRVSRVTLTCFAQKYVWLIWCCSAHTEPMQNSQNAFALARGVIILCPMDSTCQEIPSYRTDDATESHKSVDRWLGDTRHSANQGHTLFWLLTMRLHWCLRAVCMKTGHTARARFRVWPAHSKYLKTNFIHLFLIRSVFLNAKAIEYEYLSRLCV